MEVYGDLLSQPTRLVLQVAACVNVPVTFKRADMVGGELATKEFRAMNPNGQIPVLAEGKYYLFESNAISKYIIGDRVTALYPKDAKVRGHVDQWLDWKHGNLREGCTGMLRRMMLKKAPVDALPEKLQRTFKEVPMEREARQMMDALKILEEQLSRTKLFLVEGTKSPTLADLAVFEEVDQLCLLPAGAPPPMGSDLASAFPNVAKWIERVRDAKLPGFDAIHTILNKRREKLKSQAKL